MSFLPGITFHFACFREWDASLPIEAVRYYNWCQSWDFSLYMSQKYKIIRNRKSFKNISRANLPGFVLLPTLFPHSSRPLKLDTGRILELTTLTWINQQTSFPIFLTHLPFSLPWSRQTVIGFKLHPRGGWYNGRATGKVFPSRIPFREITGTTPYPVPIPQSMF